MKVVKDHDLVYFIFCYKALYRIFIYSSIINSYRATTQAPGRIWRPEEKALACHATRVEYTQSQH